MVFGNILLFLLLLLSIITYESNSENTNLTPLALVIFYIFIRSMATL